MTVKNQNTKNKGIPLKVLILEDRASDAELMLHELRAAGYKPTWQRVETESDYGSALNDSLDLILADFNLPQFTGRQAIDILNQSGLNIPLIIITGTLEETALECLKRGAVDYLLKDRMGRLGPAVKKALEDKLIRKDKKLTAEALRESEQRYRGVAETALTGLSTADPDENITYSNPALADMLGYTNQELLGMPLSQIIDPAEYHRIQTETGKRKHGLSTQYETKIIRKDGESRTVIISASPLTSENGEYEGSQAVITDISERIQAEEKQRAIEDRYRAVVENSHNGILIVNEDYKFEYVNDPLCLILGRSREEIIGHDFRKFLDEESEKLVDDMYVRRRRGEEIPARYEFNILRKDGEPRRVEISSAIVIDLKGKVQTISQIMDITEQVQAKNALGESEEKLRLMIDNSPIGFSATDMKGYFIDLNPVMCQMVGYSKNELISKHYSQISHFDENDKNKELYQSLVKGEIAYFNLEKKYIHKNGDILHVRIRSQLARNIDGEPLFEFALVEDITERVQAEAQLKLQSLALESAANGIVITDAVGNIQWANPAFSTLTGYPLDDVIGKNPRFLKSNQQNKKFYKTLWDTISAGEVWLGEVINKRADGELYTEEMTIAPLLNEKNEISNYIAIKQDISDRVRAMEEIQQRTEDLALINAINIAANQGMDLPELLILLNKEAKKVFGSKSSALYLYNQDDKCLTLQNLAIPPETVRRIENLIGISLPEICIPVEDGSYTQELLNAKEPKLINDSKIILKWMLEFSKASNLSEKLRPVIRKSISQIYKLVNIKSVITVPLISAGEVIGLMDFSRVEPFTWEEAKRAANVVGQLTAAITNLRVEKERTRSRKLLLTLNQAAPVVQQANSTDGIFRAIGEEVKKIGLNVTVFTLQEDEKKLAVTYHNLSDLARKIEKLTGLSSVNYSFPLKQGGYFHKILRGGKAVFSQFEIEPIAETLPKLVKPLAGRIMELLGRQQSIIAPLAVAGEVQGLLSISGPELTVADIPAVSTFANQAAVALEKTRLFHETEVLAAFNENIVQNMAEGIVLEDIEGMITFVNPSAAKMLGYTVDEWVGKHWTEIIPIDQQSIIQDTGERRIRGESDRYELELVNKEGQRITVLVGGSPRLDREGQFIGTMAVFTDITERKQTEEKISRYSRIFEDSLNEIFLFEPDTLKFTQVNAAGQNNLGYTMEELYELTPLDIKPEITAKSFEYLIAPLRKKETDRVVIETVHKRKDGSLYNVEVHLQLLSYEDKSLFAAIIMDVTDRYNAELENKRYIRRLDALLNIDQAIMSSFDLQVTLNIILEHMIAQLAVDAVAVLSYQADLQALTFTQSRGFQTSALQTADLRLGEGYAGEVGLQREHVFVPDLNLAIGKFKDSPQFSQEGFVSYYGVPLLAKGKLVGVLEIYHRSLLDPDNDWVNYLRLLAGQVAIAMDNISLFDELQRTNVNLTLAYDATIEGWAHALELKDMETEGHSRRVVKMTMDLARRMGISGEKLSHVRRGALLHDIGKMGIPDSILLKTGKLSDDEWEIMRQHPVYAYDWLSRIQYLRPALDIPYSHHERWDGTGYPLGLEGEQIPLAARIFAIIDVWDALNADRPYRKAWPKEKILAHIKEQSGKHFDPEVVVNLLDMLENSPTRQEL